MTYEEKVLERKRLKEELYGEDDNYSGGCLRIPGKNLTREVSISICMLRGDTQEDYDEQIRHSYIDWEIEQLKKWIAGDYE
jgi:hypothetical protein